MSINGVPLTIKTADESGALTQIERPVFATVRRCPELLAKIKAIGRATIQEAKAARKAHEAAILLQDCTPDQIDAATEAASKTSDELADATGVVFAAVRDFVITGFTGAGYTPDQAEHYANMVPGDRLGELRAACQLGCGPLDFYEAGAELTPAERASMPPDAQIALATAAAIISIQPLQRWLIARAVAEARYYRAALLQAGIDPDTHPPEDALLLACGKDGGLTAYDDYTRDHAKALASAHGGHTR